MTRSNRRSPKAVLLLVGAAVLAASVLFARPPDRPDLSAEPALGSVKGVVTWAGDEIPSPTSVRNSTDPELCGTTHSLEDMVVDSASKGVRHTIVTFVDMPTGSAPEHTPRRVELDNRECTFRPHVVVAMVGDTIATTNADDILHTTHYYGVLRGNISLPPGELVVRRVLQLPGLVTVLCDLHGWMKAFIRVDDHPFHAVTDAQGRYSIPDVPAGTRTLAFWHERYGEQTVSVDIEAGETAEINISFDSRPPES